MKVYKFVNHLVLGMTLVLVPLLTACSGGGDGGGGNSLEDPIGDISGTWSIAETVETATADCSGEVGTSTNYPVSISQSSNDLTVSAYIPDLGTYKDFKGTLDGNKIEWTGTYPEDGGTTTIESMDITVDSTCNTLHGSANWSWSDGTYSCTGTTSVFGTRDVSAGCGDTGGTNPPTEELTFFEEDMAHKWSRYHAYDGSYQYYIFKDDRTACYFEITSSGSRTNQRSYTHWKLEETSTSNVFDIVLTSSSGSTRSLDEFHYPENEIWYGGSSSLDMFPSTTSRTCQP